MYLLSEIVFLIDNLNKVVPRIWSFVLLYKDEGPLFFIRKGGDNNVVNRRRL